MTRLSIVCVTKCEAHVEPFLANIVRLAGHLDAEMVFGLDGTSPHQSLVQGSSSIVVPVFGRFLEEMIDPALDAASGRFILRLDDDERCSDEMVKWLESGVYTNHDSWFFPRVHLWPTRDSVITSLPYFPDFQGRLTTKEKAYRAPTIHAGSPYASFRAPCYMEHHNLLTKTKEQRRELTARYHTIIHGTPLTAADVDTVYPEDAPEDYIKTEPLAGMKIMERADQIKWWRQVGEEAGIPLRLQRELEQGLRARDKVLRPREM